MQEGIPGTERNGLMVNGAECHLDILIAATDSLHNARPVASHR